MTGASGPHRVTDIAQEHNIPTGNLMAGKRGLVMGVNLLQTAFSAALGQALVPLSADPLLVWNYVVVAVLASAGGIGFWFTWRGLDKREDELNMIGKTKYKGRGAALKDEERIN